jgi:DNA replication factor GINS
MSSSEININSLFAIVLRETESDTTPQELTPDLYQSVSDLLGKLKREEYDNVEKKVKYALITMVTSLITLLLKIRLEKAIENKIIDYTNLLDEEKFIIDADNEMRDRHEMILAGILNGKSKLLESITYNHKTKSTVVCFLQEMDQIVGADLEKYGPFKTEDIATIPYENAQALMIKKIVTKIRWDD